MVDKEKDEKQKAAALSGELKKQEKEQGLLDILSEH